MIGLVVAILLGSAVASAQRPLPETLGGIVQEAERLRVRVGFLARRAGERNALFARRIQEGFVPASNMKLCTALLVLEALGPDHVFTTKFFLHEEEGKKVLRVRSGGDPCLSSENTAAPPPFAGLVAALRRGGIPELGGIFLEREGWTGRDRPPDWPGDQLNKAYAAATGPFVLEEGCFRVILRPGSRKSGACPVVIEPAGFTMPLRGRVGITRSRSQGRKPIVTLRQDCVELGGRIWYGTKEASYPLPAFDPEIVYVCALRHALTTAGISVGGQRDKPPTGKGELVHENRSGLDWSLRRLLEDSVNFQAEQLLRVVGLDVEGKPTLAAGRRLLEERFRRFAPGPDEWRVADGSGLSKTNRTSPRLLVAALKEVLGSKGRRSYVDALPQSGVSGSLRRRMKEIRGRVRAKTGWVRGASGLSGTVLAKSGRLVLFSILMNYDPKRGGLNQRLKGLQDRLVKALYDGA